MPQPCAPSHRVAASSKYSYSPRTYGCRYQLFDDPTISALYPRLVSRGCPAAAAGCGAQGGMLVYLTGTNLAEAGATYYCRFTRRRALRLPLVRW